MDHFYGGGDRVQVRVCDACGSGVTFPLAYGDELARFYPDEYGPHNSARTPLLAWISRAIVRNQTRTALSRPPLRSIVACRPGALVDVGCGRGDLAAAFLSRGWEVTGVEPSARACQAAAAKGASVLQGTLATVALERNAFDAAIFQHSLEHTDDVERDLRLVAAALRNGGLLAVTVPNFDSWQRQRFRERWFPLDLPRHRVHFTRHGLLAALGRAGFEVDAVTTSSSSVALPATVQYVLFGRCLFPSGAAFRIAAGLCVLQLPLARMLDRIGGGGDQLHAAAHLAR